MLYRLWHRLQLIRFLAFGFLPCVAGVCEELPDTPAYRKPLEDQHLAVGEWLIRVSTLGTALRPEHELEISSRGTIRLHHVKRLPTPSPLKPNATREEIVNAVNANTVLEFSGPISVADREEAYQTVLSIARDFEALSLPRDGSDAARQIVVISCTGSLQIQFDANELDGHSKVFHAYFDQLYSTVNRSMPQEHKLGIRPFRPLDR